MENQDFGPTAEMENHEQVLKVLRYATMAWEE